jgi:hypothetical protein
VNQFLNEKIFDVNPLLIKKNISWRSRFYI